MSYKKPLQKLIAFTEHSPDYQSVQKDMKEGWHLISLVKNGNYYVGIMELPDPATLQPGAFFIPPRKKIKISSS